MRKILMVTLAAALLLGAFAPTAVLAQEGEKMEAGTDPRDFAAKFMPYFRYTELENGLEQLDFVMFGLVPFTKDVAMTYEIPVAQGRDVGGTALSNPATGGCLGGTLEGGGVVAPTGQRWEGDCKATGIGDMNFRFMANLPGKFLGGDWMVALQLDLPTATSPELAGESFNLGPALIYVHDIPIWPAPGSFFAMMNFYFFDVWQDEDVQDVSMYVGRWFFMFPISPKPFQGVYLLPEMQPVYDFENDHFSFWIAPELGTMLKPGNILYLKPGWTISPDPEDRKFTFEVGYRFFF